MEDEKDVVVTETKEPEQKGFSIASMVLGIVGIFVAPIPCGILAIVFGAIGLKKGGKGFAIAGLVLGIVDIVLGLIWFVTVMAAVISMF